MSDFVIGFALGMLFTGITIIGVGNPPPVGLLLLPFGVLLVSLIIRLYDD